MNDKEVLFLGGVRCYLLPGWPYPSHRARWIPYTHCEYWVPLLDTDDIASARAKVQELENYVTLVHRLKKQAVFDKWWCQIEQELNATACGCCYPATVNRGAR